MSADLYSNELLDINLQNISNELIELVISSEPEKGVSNTPGENTFTGAAACGSKQTLQHLNQRSYQGYLYCDVQPSLVSATHQHALTGAGGMQVMQSSADPTHYNFPRPLHMYTTPDRNTGPIPAICSAFYAKNTKPQNLGLGYGGLRKSQKPFQRSDKKRTQEVASDNTVADMPNTKEKSPVLRLMRLFREMYYYLNDTLPISFTEPNADWMSATRQLRPFYPNTMNFQTQVKQAARSCNEFFFKMQAILNANSEYDKKYIECLVSLNGLQQCIQKLELFKNGTLHHRDGKFLTEEARATAEYLELHMKQLNEQIRETNIFVHVYNWLVEKMRSQQRPIPYALEQNTAPVIAELASVMGTAEIASNSGGGGADVGDDGASGGNGHGNVANAQLATARVNRRLPLRYIG